MACRVSLITRGDSSNYEPLPGPSPEVCRQGAAPPHHSRQGKEETVQNGGAPAACNRGVIHAAAGQPVPPSDSNQPLARSLALTRRPAPEEKRPQVHSCVASRPPRLWQPGASAGQRRCRRAARARDVTDWEPGGALCRTGGSGARPQAAAVPVPGGSNGGLAAGLRACGRAWDGADSFSIISAAIKRSNPIRPSTRYTVRAANSIDELIT